tara:strand:+ start:197 stop:1924 length:1728 start_codon:yes stop_codon:yes gene_type:complete
MLFSKQSKTLQKKYIFFVFVVLIMCVFVRYYKLQILDFEKYKLLGEKNSISARILNAPRGIIYDRNNFPIVDNKFIYDIKIIPNNFDKNSFNYKIMSDLAGIEKNYIDSILLYTENKVSRFKPHLLKRHVNFKTKSILEENKLDLKGIYFSEFPIRTFTKKCQLSHVIGYLREHEKGNVIPFNGLEKIYDSILKGRDGVEYHMIDSRGIDQGKIDFENKNFIPIQGNNLLLSIDINLQSFCEDLIQNYKGSIIVSNPENGEILSMFSFPDFNLSSFTGPISHEEWEKLNNNENSIFINRSIQSKYPPGSIFKLILAAIVLDKEIITKDWRVNCKGKYQFFDTAFHCWKEDGHGIINLNEAIQQSCNIYFYNLIQKIDLKLWSEEVKNFGFGTYSAIDLTSEKKGLVPDKKIMDQLYGNRGGWSKGHLLNLSIGQGETLVTPIQICNLMNYICNEGFVFTPHIKKNIEVDKHTIEYNNYVWKIIKNSMSDAVYKKGGTAYNAKVNNRNAKVYGKTGTVQVCSDCDILPHAWFAGFLESPNNKKYSISIIIENGGKGSNIPAKIAKDVFEFLINNDI